MARLHLGGLVQVPGVSQRIESVLTQLGGSPAASGFSHEPTLAKKSLLVEPRLLRGRAVREVVALPFGVASEIEQFFVGDGQPFR